MFDGVEQNTKTSYTYERFNKHHPFYNKPNDSFNPVCKRRILTTKYTPSKPYSYFCVKFKSFLPCDRDEGRETETKYTSNERESYHPVVWILLWIHGNKYTKMNSVKDIDEMYVCTMQSKIPMLWHRSAWTNPVEISWCCFNKNEYHTPTPSVNASLFRFHQVCHSIEHFYYSHFACYVYAIEEKKNTKSTTTTMTSVNVYTFKQNSCDAKRYHGQPPTSTSWLKWISAK